MCICVVQMLLEVIGNRCPWNWSCELLIVGTGS